jgi:hypothetical protein
MINRLHAINVPTGTFIAMLFDLPSHYRFAALSQQFLTTLPKAVDVPLPQFVGW